MILAYGVASQALRFPNSAREWSVLKGVVYLPYWQMYGELFLDNVEGNVFAYFFEKNRILNVPAVMKYAPTAHSEAVANMKGQYRQQRHC